MTPLEAQILMELISIGVKDGLPALLRFVRTIEGDEPSIEYIRSMHDNFDPLTEDDFK